MNLLDLPVKSITSPDWNPNEMDPDMTARLRRSIERFGFLAPLVVKRVGVSQYETIGGAQRLSVLRDMGADVVPCIVVDLDDVDARLLAQALNHIAGEDNPGLRARLLRELLAQIPEQELLLVLPETHESLNALASLGQEDLVSRLRAWQEGRGERLKHFTARLTPDQKVVVDEVIGPFLARITPGQDGNPNPKGLALYRLCRAYKHLQEANA